MFTHAVAEGFRLSAFMARIKLSVEINRLHLSGTSEASQHLRGRSENKQSRLPAPRIDAAVFSKDIREHQRRY